MDKYSIYALLDEQGRPFYIGQSKRLKKRISDHRYQAKWTNPLFIYRKIRKIWASGGNFTWKVLEEGLTLEQADEREKFYIKWHKDLGFKLYNLTDGGKGNPGYECSEENKEYFRKIKTGKSWGEHSEETKKLLSKQKKGKKLSDEHKQKLAIARNKRQISKETRNKCSETSKGKINIKVVTLISPLGEEVVTTNGLTVFCEENSLTHANLAKVVRGERAHHKGWKLKKDS